MLYDYHDTIAHSPCVQSKRTTTTMPMQGNFLPVLQASPPANGVKMGLMATPS